LPKKPDSFGGPGFCQHTELYGSAPRPPLALRLRIEWPRQSSKQEEQELNLEKFRNAQ
jgi:hypothetical protein